MSKKQNTAAAENAPKADAATEVQGAQNTDGTAQAADNTAAAAYVPKIKKILTLPLLKLKLGEAVYVKFAGPTFIGKRIDEGKGEKSKEPPVMANVHNLATGELVQIMLGSVLQGILRDEYPNNGYVNKSFQIILAEQKRGRQGGNYNTYNVAELDD